MLYFMRHGQDDETYIGGWSDVDLLPEGVVEVQDSAHWMKDNLKIKRIMCSDVKRAISSAKIVSDILGIDYETSPKLREQNKGLLNGMVKEEAYATYPELQEKNITVDTVFPNGESLKDLYTRMQAYLGEILALEDDTLLVTHRGVINMMYFLLQNQEPTMDKKQFGVTTGSVHELDKQKMLIRKVR